LLRYNLRAADIFEIDINQEIKAIQDYLGIEKIRLGERLNYTIPNVVNRFNLPPLLLLTLVENAIKHGISKAVEGGKLELKIDNRSGDITISVLNSGKPLKHQYEIGFGLKTLKQLLDIHYHGKAIFRLYSSEKCTNAVILIKKDDKI